MGNASSSVPQSRVGGMCWRCRCGCELMLLGARVVRSIVHMAVRVLVVIFRQVAVVVSGVGGGGWCSNVWLSRSSLHGGTEQRAQVPSDE